MAEKYHLRFCDEKKLRIRTMTSTRRNGCFLQGILGFGGDEEIFSAVVIRESKSLAFKFSGIERGVFQLLADEFAGGKPEPAGYVGSVAEEVLAQAE